MSRMLPPVLTVVLFMLHTALCAQSPKETVVLANEFHNVNFFFPESITKFILGASHFKFTHEAQTQIGSLKGRKGKDTNLTVITNDGNIYSFLLRYGSKIDTYNVMVQAHEAIGNIKGSARSTSQMDNNSSQQKPTPLTTPIDPKPEFPKTPVRQPTEEPNKESVTYPTVAETNSYKKPPEGKLSAENQASENYYLPPPTDTNSEEENDLYHSDKEAYYRIFCENNFMQPSYIKRTFTTSKNMVLRIKNILGDRNELYFVLQIENNSKSTYTLDYLNFFKQTKSPKNQLLMEPLFHYNVKREMEPQSMNEVVYVFKKFKIHPKEKVVIVLDEKEGKRTLVLSIYDKQVNTIKI